MAFYGNTPYIAIKNQYSQNARILVLKNDKWEYIKPLTTPSGDPINSDYFFYIDSAGTMYFSFLVGFFQILAILKYLKNQ